MQGFNMGRYVPPEHEGVLSANQLAGKHALGARGRKASSGILTVRFEMPYAIWCNTCPKPTIVGQGVRFNAEKKKVDAYYSTPIYSFRMKHTACGGWIEIRTDPKNTAYIVTEGARKKDTGEDKIRDDELEILTPEERERRQEDAFAALEGKVVDSHKAKEQSTRIADLQAISERDWSDTYSLNRKLRHSFRIERKGREKEAAVAEELQDKYSLEIDMVPANEDDARRAELVDFGDFDQSRSGGGVDGKPMFLPATPSKQSKPGKAKRKLDTEKTAQLRKIALQQRLQGNTRLSTDPFINGDKGQRVAEVELPVLKRKRRRSIGTKKIVEEAGQSENEAPKGGGVSTSLVDYGSDSS
ncbi:MAG: hypothetical protein M1814_003869 [Vezdaea aestivalis]|nr:MAG: hypothetical protein M1814_003869 [Vezdaea aestivalis]